MDASGGINVLKTPLPMPLSLDHRPGRRQAASLTRTAPWASNQLEFACNIPGHDASGMNEDINLQG